MERTKVYFASDVHLGLNVGDPAEREARFVGFLKGIDAAQTEAVYLLGDVWDFWYEYRDVVPKQGARVVAQLLALQDAGVKIFFMAGNHDIWCFHWFEELGFTKISQPYFTQMGSLRVCLGHGDGLGGASWSYRLMLRVFHSRFCQALFSTLHPRLAFSFARKWSEGNRGKHPAYVWKGESEPLYKYASGLEADAFVFGHIHARVEDTLPSGAKIYVLDDWIKGGTPYLELNLLAGSFTFFGSLPKIEK